MTFKLTKIYVVEHEDDYLDNYENEDDKYWYTVCKTPEKALQAAREITKSSIFECTVDKELRAKVVFEEVTPKKKGRK